MRKRVGSQVQRSQESKGHMKLSPSDKNLLEHLRKQAINTASSPHFRPITRYDVMVDENVLTTGFSAKSREELVIALDSFVGRNFRVLDSKGITKFMVNKSLSERVSYRLYDIRS